MTDYKVGDIVKHRRLGYARITQLLDDGTVEIHVASDGANKIVSEKAISHVKY